MCVLNAFLSLFVLSPRIYSENGNLKFQAPAHKNVTFETSGTGGVLFNGRDLSDAARKVKTFGIFAEFVFSETGHLQAGEAVERIKIFSTIYEDNFQRYDRYGNLIEGSDGILSRLQTLERNAINGSTANFTVIGKHFRKKFNV